MNQFHSNSDSDKQVILVTGSSGFIGKHLISALKLKGDYKILSFTRDHSMDDLKEFILRSNFIFHLASEVRPNAEKHDIACSCNYLTKDIINILESENLFLPILFTSSIHAKIPLTEYAKSKKESEILIQNYSKKYNIECYIFQLVHIFGESCKPNYNSVITTWIYNTINNIDIHVVDKDQVMIYLYVHDLILQLIKTMKYGSKTMRVTPMLTNQTTLGEVVEYLNEFKSYERKLIDTFDNDFKEKLYKTYSSYI